MPMDLLEQPAAAISRNLFADILRLIAELPSSPDAAPA
jgi:hypothetical protein